MAKYLTEDHANIFLIVPDRMAGKKSRYTVHSISLVVDKGSQVIGRELDLPTAKAVASTWHVLHKRRLDWKRVS